MRKFGGNSYMVAMLTVEHLHHLHGALVNTNVNNSNVH